jgi:iron-sulfur cluster assembly protein
MITITEKAKDQLIKLMNEQNIDYNLRVGVTGGGCAGFSYFMEFDNIINENDEIFEDNGIAVTIDKRSLLYIFGTELHFSDGLNGKGFEWKNPNAERVCSCGTSFGV